jgi:hypothetical protein
MASGNGGGKLKKRDAATRRKFAKSIAKKAKARRNLRSNFAT